MVVRWHKLGEVDSEYTSEKHVLSAISVPKKFTIGRNLAKFWQKISLLSFFETRCIYRSSSAIWDYAVLPATRHRWTHPALTQPVSWYSIYLPHAEGWKAELTYRLLGNAPAGSRTRDLSSPTPYTLPSHSYLLLDDFGKIIRICI